MKKIIIGADGSGYELKEAVKNYLESEGIECVDVGALSIGDNKPYYDTARDLAKAIQRKEFEKGLLFCGTGMGMSIVANKFKGIYASCVESVYSATKCRAINNANVLCMGGFILGSDLAINMVKAFLTTSITEGMPEKFHDFLKDTYVKIQQIDEDCCK